MSSKQSKGIAYIGSFDPDYSRNRIIIKGLKSHLISVLISSVIDQKWFEKYINLFVFLFKNRNNYSSILVGFPGWFEMPITFVIGKLLKKKTIFDVFTPLYETYYLDRKQVRFGPFYYFIDWLNFKLADIVLADTNAHLKVYIKDYGLNSKKGLVVNLGVDNKLFYPKNLKKDIDVFFYGSYQPLQGVEHIVKAAIKLPNLKFLLVGKGQTRKIIDQIVKNTKIKNIQFIDWVNFTELNNLINRSKIVLGIFGDSIKADSVIPNKVYDAMATKSVIINLKTQAIQELIQNNHNGYLIDSPDELSDKIIEILKDTRKMNKVGNNAYKLMTEKYLPSEVVKKLVKII